MISTYLWSIPQVPPQMLWESPQQAHLQMARGFCSLWGRQKIIYVSLQFNDVLVIFIHHHVSISVDIEILMSITKYAKCIDGLLQT